LATAPKIDGNMQLYKVEAFEQAVEENIFTEQG
jgi:hypothetical protein